MTHIIISNKFIDISADLNHWFFSTANLYQSQIVSVVSVSHKDKWITTITYNIN